MVRRKGFTLVELLVTSSMLALLAGAGYAVFAAGLQSGGKARRVGTMVSCGQRALEAMAADIRMACEHDGTRMTSLDARYGALSADTVDFIVPRRRPAYGPPEGDARCEVGYYIDNDPDTEARWLLRREDNTLDDDPLEGGTVTLAGPCVSELDLQFFDGREWKAGWEDQSSFPRAVRIGIVAVDAEEKEEPLYLETCVSVPSR
jgi:type II secretion system protein J